MAIEYRRGENDSIEQSVVTTECSFCGEELQDGKGMAEHISECDVL